MRGRSGLRVRHNRGFTLIETALATVIIGVGVVAVVEAQQAFLRSNRWSSHASSATLMGNEIRELTRDFPRHDSVSGLMIGGDPPALQGWGADLGEIVVWDFDDMDDFDEIQFGNGGQLPGPIDAFGNIIPQILPDGTVVLDGNGNPLPLEGWSQRVVVQKVLPTNLTQIVADGHVILPGPGVGVPVDAFPLRVTVIVEYQGPYDPQPVEVNRIVWIVP